MLNILVRAVVLFAHAHAIWPAAPVDRVLAASYVAATAETHAVPAEILLAITEHESDWSGNAVSWRYPGHDRVDLLWDGRSRIPARCVYGYLQATGTSGDAAREIARDGGMSAGVAELEEWATSCRGDLACALRGHAGGTRCALYDDCSPAARAFARLFMSNARRLGMPARRIAT